MGQAEDNELMVQGAAKIDELIAERDRLKKECDEYMEAMLKAREELADAMESRDGLVMEFHQALEDVAQAAGIAIGRESWWDNKRDRQVAMVIERVASMRKKLKGKKR